jgi:hypothetical protein
LHLLPGTRGSDTPKIGSAQVYRQSIPASRQPHCARYFTNVTLIFQHREARLPYEP